MWAPRAKRLLERLEEGESGVAKQAQIEQENVPETDAIAQLATEREALKHEMAELESTDSAMGEDIERQRRELERWEQKLARLIEEEARAEDARQDRARILQHSVRVRATLDAFRRKVIERHVRRIEHLVLESYQQLLRKSALVTRLSIDPDTLSLTLYGRDGNVLSAERLSAGERQLLAIALLWGLAKASGRPLPTAIDTPLGRLDSGHRMHLVERYLPFASHQVLLLSTDEEIAGEYLKRLNPWIGRTYQLSYDDEAGETQIRPGYFKARRRRHSGDRTHTAVAAGQRSADETQACDRHRPLERALPVGLLRISCRAKRAAGRENSGGQQCRNELEGVRRTLRGSVPGVAEGTMRAGGARQCSRRSGAAIPAAPSPRDLLPRREQGATQDRRSGFACLASRVKANAGFDFPAQDRNVACGTVPTDQVGSD